MPWRLRRRPRKSNGRDTWIVGKAPHEEDAVKLASLRRGGRDGRLVVVSRDLTRCQWVPGIAPTLQAALDDWEAVAPRLKERAAALERNASHADVMPFDPVQCAAPL